jgi:hypothetical protein
MSGERVVIFHVGENSMPCKEPFNLEQMLSIYWWKLLLTNLLGGRPMQDNGLAFVDQVSGKSVRNYTDKFGRKWMADGGRWSLFRVRRSET